MLLYLHGFESSPDSDKAQFMKRAVEAAGKQCLLPQLPASMVATKQLLDDYINSHAISAVMGSSLGGFWAHYVASEIVRLKQQQLRGVLINPAVAPGPRFDHYERERYHPYLKQSYQLTDADVACLQDAGSKLTQQSQLLVLLQQGDETLNYRDATEFYQSQRLVVEHGGNHRFVGLERYVPTLLEFLKIM